MKKQQASKPINVENIIKRETAKITIAGILLIMVGVGIVTLELVLLQKIISGPLVGQLSMAIDILLLLALIIATTSAATKNIIKSSRDEYQYHLDVESRAKAFNFLQYGVLVIALLLGGAGRVATGAIVVMVAVSWLIVARGGGRVDV